MNETDPARADALMAEWVDAYVEIEYGGGMYLTTFEEWMSTAIANVASGTDPASAAEEHFERAYDRAHGGPGGTFAPVRVNEAMGDRARDYDGLDLTRVVELLAARGHVINTRGLIKPPGE